MKNLLYAILIGLFPVISDCAGYHENSPLAVTYVANEGFLIECENKKILIDALFGGKAQPYFIPSDSIVELMKAAQSPFDNIDLIAVTHAHMDHFNPQIVAAHMKHNPRAILVCPPQVGEKLESAADYSAIKDRIRAVWSPSDSAISTEIAGMKLRIFPGRHGAYYELDSLTGQSVDIHRNVQHLEYLFSIGNRASYHCGDAPMNDMKRYQSYTLERDSIDVACVQWWDAKEALSFRQKLIKDILRPDRVILMHLAPARPPRGNPERQTVVAKEVIVPRRSMEKWIFH
ncbi:MAG: MBL fold metallo-hydrolase [candidate division Zixibacteria bacterium]|nr:MBL fold metallo-hydrolase [candidate division Zixibacteria bacterium]